MSLYPSVYPSVVYTYPGTPLDEHTTARYRTMYRCSTWQMCTSGGQSVHRWVLLREVLQRCDPTVTSLLSTKSKVTTSLWQAKVIYCLRIRIKSGCRKENLWLSLAYSGVAN